jgi:ribosomal protein S18 acetylase RimI-like enzyme
VQLTGKIDMLQYKINANGNQHVEKAILDILNEYNQSHVEFFDYIPFTIYAKDDDKIVAGIIGSIRTGYDCYIDTIAVDKAHRGQGIGSNLLTEIENLAISHRCTHILVETAVFQNNSFYENRGFIRLATIEKAFLGRDFYVMKKEL